ncbi:hypothetical protein HMPREF9075_00019 [Capnocytophaga sp. oral taxon 332 str. F0381]|nr:hypothetical protein HMPREF9075_00019 [Capnocytophaga sp. oral taxon 332 str. F0381]
MSKIPSILFICYLFYYLKKKVYFLCRGSDETVSFLRPFALRRANTFLPLAVAIRSLKPCLFLLFLLEG